MQVEVSVALNFVMSYLYNKLPRRRVDMFAEEVEKGLKKKFEGHWYPEKPCKGSGFRCMRVGGDKMDPVLTAAARASGLDTTEVLEYLPKELTVWIDPKEVSCRVGEKGIVKILYSDPKDDEDPEEAAIVDREVQSANHGFGQESEGFKPIDSLSSSLGNVSLSASPSAWLNQNGSVSPSHHSNQQSAAKVFANNTSPINSFSNRNNNKTTFTAATFAQTKFGSTKLKTQAKRPTRLSPTEMGSFVKQRSPPAGPWGSVSPVALAGGLSPVSGTAVLPGVGIPLLSPGDPRLDLVEQQQRLLMLQQIQIQQQLSGSGLQPGSNIPSPVNAPPGLYSPVTSDLLSPGSSRAGLHGFPGPMSVPSPRHHQQSPSPHLSPSRSASNVPSPTDGSSGKSLTDSNLHCTGNQSPYANLQHLLVAN